MAKLLKIPNFHFVMRDEMHLIPKDIIPLIVTTNIHTSKENGVHHSSFYCSDSENYFFNGLPPTKEVEKILGEGISSNFKIQEEGTKYCGQMSSNVLYRMTATDAKFTDIILLLTLEIPPLLST